MEGEGPGATLPLSSSSTTRKTSATVAVRLSSWVRSPRTVRTRTSCAASSSDRALAACSSLLPYASTQSKPFSASRCAVASPIPPEPPVMMATVAASASAEQCTAARRARPARGSGATKAARLHAGRRRPRSASLILVGSWRKLLGFGARFPLCANRRATRLQAPGLARKAQ